jgi:hypothetical protein
MVTRGHAPIGVLLCAALLSPVFAQSAGMKVKGARKAKPAMMPAPPPTNPPTAPEPQAPLRPAQMPPLAPRISYADGQLTVTAENCTMGDILAGIRQATGIRIETTGGPDSERVAAKIGPAPVRSVLVSLFSGAPFDYVILASASDPERVERVLLSPKTAGGSPISRGAPARPAAMPVPQRTMTTPDEDENEGFAEPQPQPAAPPVQPPDQNQPELPPGNDPNQGRDPRGERPR